MSTSTQVLAKRFKSHFFDISTPFLGRAAESTYILRGNEHPNALGYSVIAQQMIGEDEEEDD